MCSIPTSPPNTPPPPDSLPRLDIEAAPLGIAVFDTAMCFLAANRRFREDFMIRACDLRGLSWYDVVPQMPQRWRDAHRRCLAGETESHDEDPLDRADGSRAYFRWVCQPWRDAAGQVGGLAVFAQDVTEETRQHRAARRWADAVEQAGFSLSIVDAGSNTLQYANPAFARLLATAPEQIRGRDVLDTYAPAERARISELLAAADRDGNVVFEADRLRGDGSTFPALVAITAVREPGGPAPYRVGTTTDISELKRVEAQLQQAHRLSMLGEMATGLAHELSQPLALMSMAAENAIEMVQCGTGDTAAVIAKLHRVIAQAERAGQIIRHVRSFGRMDVGPPTPTSLQDAVAGTLAMMQSRLRKSKVDVSVSLPPDVPQAMLARVHLEQVLTNLLLNACDAYDAGGSSERTVALAAWREDAEVVFTVTDRAGGIPQDALSRVFEPFFTTKPVGEGTGLGLSISHGIVTAAGGSLSVRNADGGACFEVRLPGLPNGAERCPAKPAHG